MKYEYKTKPNKCPMCGSSRIADILYGYCKFSKELENAVRTGKVVLGGCVLTGNEPTWQCVDCNTTFFRKET